MKTFTTIMCMLLLQVAVLFGQNQPAFDPGVTWTAQVGKEFAGQFVIVEMYYKDFNDNIVYDETQGGTVDANGFLSFVVGHGSTPDKLKAEDFLRISTFCWGIGLDSAPVDGMQAVTSAPKANVAAHAVNAEKLNNSTVAKNTVTPLEFSTVKPDEIKSVLVQTTGPEEGDGMIRRVDVTDFIACEKTTSPITGDMIDVLRIGTGQLKPIVFGGETPTLLEHFITICGLIDDFRHVLTVKALLAEEVGPRRSAHNSAAIYADNSANEMSAGVLALAQTWGLYGTAQNGVVGITNGLSNGAGITGFVGNAPDAGGFKYGLYGNSNSQAGSWGLAIFGNGFHTGTLTMSSDARLKTEIRAQSKALDKVMQLRPSSYTYRQDTPYSLPSGIHHGFLAQDVEQIFPELVSDISMPLSLDPQSIYKSETTEYKGINYIEMIAILTSAIQELNTSLNAKIDEQAKEIAELRVKLNARAN